MKTLEKIFGIKKPIIGALHFSPMLGYAGFTSKDAILEKANFDLEAFLAKNMGKLTDEERHLVLTYGGISADEYELRHAGIGVDGIIIENNYDFPHKINVGPETIAMMAYFGAEIRKKTNLPIGVSVLFNDYRAALAIAKVIGAKFIRVPVFVDDVKTDFGDICGNAKDVIEYRRSIGAEGVAIFADVQVKHAEMLDKTKTMALSTKQAIESGADAIILTGRWTGDAPNMEKLREARSAAGDFPILLGSGVDKENVLELFKYADGAIVSTSLKEGEKVAGERNVKPYDYRISETRVREFMQEVERVRQTLINNNKSDKI
ncbi:MAG: BtpA/SgcQ family protein [DPANN group archaeon]|nr:BtpA/SgcQ family protein [DPANN group archaeon]